MTKGNLAKLPGGGAGRLDDRRANRTGRAAARWASPPGSVDPAALAAAYDVTRGLIHAADPVEAIELVVDFVRVLGGDVVPAHEAPADAMPLDLGLGELAPMLPVAPAAGLEALNLESLLPAIVEDARMTVLRLRTEARLVDEAGRDPLTGALSRRVLVRRLSGQRAGDVVALLDLDHFKKLNDSRGHAAGDEALRAFGGVLRACVRAEDVVGRYGGEEFLLGFHDASVQVAVARIEHIRASWRKAGQPVTFSAGVAQVGPAGSAAAVSAADAAMYRAKAAGRDRTEIAHDAA